MDHTLPIGIGQALDGPATCRCWCAGKPDVPHSHTPLTGQSIIDQAEREAHQANQQQPETD